MSCVFGSAVAIRLLILTILPSLLDLSTDILNALDMILSSQGICFDCKSAFLKSFINICQDNATCIMRQKDIGSSALSKPTMGIISIIIIFLPGMVKAFKHVMTCLQKKEYKKVPKASCYLPFPLYVLFVQIKAVIDPLNWLAEQRLIRVLSMEAFYESFPQLVLQIISIIYSYQLSYIQAVSIAFSLLMLAKTVILLDSAEPIRVVINDEKESSNFSNDVHDIENLNENVIDDNNQIEQDVGKNEASGYCTTAFFALLSALRYMVWVLPLYLTSIIFKIASFSITFAYLRVYASVTMGLLIIELFVLAKYTGFKKFDDRIYPVFSNFFIVNIGGAQIREREIMNKDELKQHSTKYNDMYKFAKRSVLLSYLHHTLVLILIALLVIHVGKVDETKKLSKVTTLNGTIFSQGNNCNGTVSCAYKTINSTIADLRVHWREMHEWLYPFCKYQDCGQKRGKKNVSEEDLRLYIEEIVEEKITIEENSKIYPFMIIISSIILVGLLNLMLSVYSARDIKERNAGQLDEIQVDERDERERFELKYSFEDSDDYRLVRDAYKNGFISIKNNEIIFKTKQSAMDENNQQSIVCNDLSKQEVNVKESNRDNTYAKQNEKSDSSAIAIDVNAVVHSVEEQGVENTK